MKELMILILFLVYTLSLNSQTLSEKIYTETCKCLEKFSSIEQIEDSLQNCITKSLADVTSDCTEEEKKYISNINNLLNLMMVANELTPYDCENVKNFIIEEKIKIFYKQSDNSKANEHYEKGNDYMNNNDFDNSIKEFKKAIKVDKKFVYAYDHLAISYRKIENYKKAIKYYQKSLEIFPEGDVALLNIAAVYSISGNYINALNYYNKLIYYYKDNPEGYFGAGKILYLTSDYKNALENIFTAHIMYIENKSDYIADSEKMINIIYLDLKDKNKLELFTEIAKKYNITFKE